MKKLTQNLTAAQKNKAVEILNELDELAEKIVNLGSIAKKTGVTCSKARIRINEWNNKASKLSKELMEMINRK